MSAATKTKEWILTRIQEIKNEFYETTKKNVFFKKSQKQELANRILQELSIQDLIAASIYILPDKLDICSIYVDYSIIKMYIHPDIYDQILEKLISLLNTVSNSNGYKIHVNLEGFTITSAERHKQVIEQFCQQMECIHYLNHMQKMYIYNTPVMIDSISSFFSYLLHPEMKQKMVKYEKSESSDKIAQLFAK
jgi:hypothetical protein